MIRKLGEKDHGTVMGLLAREPEINLFMIGDIENAGYDSPSVTHWGEWDRAGRLTAVLTRYHDSLVFYSREAFDRAGFLDLIGSLPWNFFSGEAGILDAFAGCVEHRKRKNTFLARLQGPPQSGAGEAAARRVRPAALDDVPRILALRNGIEEFEVVNDGALLRQNLACGEARAWVIEERGRVVAVAQTAAESRGLAMIVGVATHQEWRRRGYATACMAALCRELVAEGKTLCLFYDNLEAGRIYKRLGFEDIGQWTMLIR